MRTQSNMSGRHVLLALAVVLVWALNFLVIRLGLQDLPPLFFAGLRFTITAIPAVFFFGRQGMPWRLILGAGTCIGVGYFSLLFVGMKLGMRALAKNQRSWLAELVLFRALRDRLGFSFLTSAATGGAAMSAAFRMTRSVVSACASMT